MRTTKIKTRIKGDRGQKAKAASQEPGTQRHLQSIRKHSTAIDSNLQLPLLYLSLHPPQTVRGGFLLARVGQFMPPLFFFSVLNSVETQKTQHNLMQTANNSSTGSVGGTAAAQLSINTSEHALFESGDEESMPLRSPQRLLRTSDISQDLLPQVPIRKESGSMQSMSLYDLDPEDSLPKPLARQSSTSLRKRAQPGFREQSSSGSSTLGPPSSVLVPQESEWSGISTLMTTEEAKEMTESTFPPRLAEEPQLPRMHREMAEKLPWDKIAIGVVMVPDNDWDGGYPDQHGEFPPPISRMEYNTSTAPSDTTPQPSMRQSSDHYSTTRDIEPAVCKGNTSSNDYCHSSQSSIPTTKEPPPPHHAMLKPTSSDRLQSCPSPSHAALLKPSRSSSNRSNNMYPNIGQHPGPPSYQPPLSPSTPSRAAISAPSFQRRSSRDLSVPSYPNMGAPTYNSGQGGSVRSNPAVTNNCGSTQSLPQQPPPAKPPPPPPVQGIMIDVAPGVKLLLRGSSETWQAIEEGRVTVTTCMFCNIELQCLDDAQLVACPDCTMLSPVDQAIGHLDNSEGRYGVGVGVKPADVVRWIQLHM
jgi:hypothetical protein